MLASLPGGVVPIARVPDAGFQVEGSNCDIHCFAAGTTGIGRGQDKGFGCGDIGLFASLVTWANTCQFADAQAVCPSHIPGECDLASAVQMLRAGAEDRDGWARAQHTCCAYGDGGLFVAGSTWSGGRQGERRGGADGRICAAAGHGAKTVVNADAAGIADGPLELDRAWCGQCGRCAGERRDGWGASGGNTTRDQHDQSGGHAPFPKML
jgi:hypothetical protein